MSDVIRLVPQIVVTPRGYVYMPRMVKNTFLRRLFATTFIRQGGR